jgi:hypothetical protein
LARRKARLPEDVWQQLKTKQVDEWEPTENDVDWLLTTVEKMKIGGRWVLPDVGATFEKVGPNHLRLQSIVSSDILNAMIAIEKTKKVGERAAIKVDIEKAADCILFYPRLEKT